MRKFFDTLRQRRGFVPHQFVMLTLIITTILMLAAIIIPRLLRSFPSAN